MGMVNEREEGKGKREEFATALENGSIIKS